MNSLVNIGALARAAGVSPRTIRYYEELGLLPEPERSPGGTRRYPPGWQRHLEAVAELRDMGFRLEDIGPLAAVMRGEAPCEVDRDTALVLLDGRITELSEKLARLAKMRDTAVGAP